MSSLLRNRFGVPGVISVIALVLAMSGGAFAAKYMITSTKQIKPSVLKQLKGNQGPAGPAGAAGAMGPAGPTGAKGADGAVGPAGPAGAPGAPGATGATGATGSPWTAGGTLPKGATETGAWSGKVGSDLFGGDAISFTIPLAAAIPAANVHTVAKNATGGTECASGTAANPKAAAGHLCVYIGASEPPATISSIKDPSAGNNPGAGISGAILTTVGDEPDEIIWGTWAVTAP